MDNDNEKIIPWTERPPRKWIPYKYPIGEIFCPIAPEGTLFLEEDEEDEAYLEDALRTVFGIISQERKIK